MQKKIEEDTGVKIIFPSSRDETSVGIYMLMLLSKLVWYNKLLVIS